MEIVKSIVSLIPAAAELISAGIKEINNCKLEQTKMQCETEMEINKEKCNTAKIIAGVASSTIIAATVTVAGAMKCKRVEER